MKKLDVNNPNDLVTLFAHDLRGTLTGIRGFADLVEQFGELNDAQMRWLQRLYLSVDRGLGMLENMIMLNQLGSQQLEIQRIDLRELIQDALYHVEYLLLEKNVVVEVDIGIDADHILCDPRWFKHVLYNLLSNAVKHNKPEGSVHIETWHGSNALFLRVSDTGKGIPSSALEHIFDKFYRVSGSKGDGSGLGLAIVHDIVERHGGSVSVESQEGEGTSFTVRMPLARSSQQHESGEDLDALDDDSQEGVDFADYDNRADP